MINYVILTDSGSDLTREEAGELNLRILDLSVTVEGEEPKPGSEIDIKELYSFLRTKSKASTAAVNIDEFEAAMEPILKEGKDILYLGFSSGLSGTFNTCMIAVEELREKYPSLDLVVLIGSVRDSRKMYEVFSTYHPDIVYHAAAHKHVPLMEDSPNEAIKNNVFGTYNVANAAGKYKTASDIILIAAPAVIQSNLHYYFIDAIFLRNRNHFFYGQLGNYNGILFRISCILRQQIVYQAVNACTDFLVSFKNPFPTYIEPRFITGIM